MTSKAKHLHLIKYLLTFIIIFILTANTINASQKNGYSINNFGHPGIIDLPNARRLPDGELVITQQLHKSLARSSISFQALPRISFSFSYSGHGIGGGEAYGRFNHDRSFDAHLSLLDEGNYWPAISLGLRDFIGTGWYSSEYVVGTKSIGNFELTAGLGFGRLAGRSSFVNPLKNLSSRFEKRGSDNDNTGGTLGGMNWFQGEASVFYGLNYTLGEKILLSLEHTPDEMTAESKYLDIKSPWNIGASYRVNNFVSMAAQYLHKSQLSLTAQINVNPDRPPLGSKELAPVPMRMRGNGAPILHQSNEEIIKKVLAADGFELNHLKIYGNAVRIVVTNTKFRSTAQAVGRIASNLQRFTSDEITVADISFQSHGMQIASFRVDLEQITTEQFNATPTQQDQTSISSVDLAPIRQIDNQKRFFWGLGPYFAHRLFNPDLPLSMETGIELEGGYQLTNGLKVSGALRKSVLTNLTKNGRRSNSLLPRVHSDWPLYDIAGQNGHIHDLTLSYVRNLAPGLYGKAQAGLLEPFFAGFGAEILFKPATSSFALGFDIQRVRKRDYDMLFDLRQYKNTIGHFSIYYDAGGLFDIEINAGSYLAGDWGATTTISRRFGSGWEVGGYATLTDVPFDVFGEGSFDKAIFVTIPVDWIVSSPNRAKRRLTLRPITRDGGANLSSARSLNRLIEESQNAKFKREFGRLWK